VQPFHVHLTVSFRKALHLCRAIAFITYVPTGFTAVPDGCCLPLLFTGWR